MVDVYFPLYFLDYETYASAFPLFDGVSPYESFPVQYSLHILDVNGTLKHEEYLEREARLPENLIAHLQAQIEPEGTIVSWHASFCNTPITNRAGK